MGLLSSCVNILQFLVYSELFSLKSELSMAAAVTAVGVAAG